MNLKYNSGSIYVSIFYNKDIFDCLLKECIMPLKYKLEEINSKVAMIVHFNYDRGDSIGITILVEKEARNDVLLVFQNKLKTFFKQQPSKNKKIISNSIFKNFPVNSVRYNLHSFPSPLVSPLNYEAQLQLSFELTSIILLTFETEFNEELVFTLCFYLHCLLIRSVSKDLKTAIDYLNNIRKINNSPADLCVIDDNEPFSDIIAEIFDNNPLVDSLLPWMKSWLRLCEYSLDGASAEKEIGIQNISTIIINQLGVDTAIKNLLFDLLWRECITMADL